MSLKNHNRIPLSLSLSLPSAIEVPSAGAAPATVLEAKTSFCGWLAVNRLYNSLDHDMLWMDSLFQCLAG